MRKASHHQPLTHPLRRTGPPGPSIATWPLLASFHHVGVRDVTIASLDCSVPVLSPPLQSLWPAVSLSQSPSSQAVSDTSPPTLSTAYLLGPPRPPASRYPICHIAATCVHRRASAQQPACRHILSTNLTQTRRFCSLFLVCPLCSSATLR
ncbi:hypothetical protein B0H16DRAFT_1733021 [Mycena metata]|uniref:Uncharacterized protein n=1 Tax=Mycena metata TaxID=1033252 RepID=A0AAD7HZX2_9AGAR|nr:hypothetical protein B0H16DRAFT_1733021 [Mycena metata]